MITEEGTGMPVVTDALRCIDQETREVVLVVRFDGVEEGIQSAW